MNITIQPRGIIFISIFKGRYQSQIHQGISYKSFEFKTVARNEYTGWRFRNSKIELLLHNWLIIYL